MTVGQKVELALALLAALLVALIAVTSLFVPLRAAIALWLGAVIFFSATALFLPIRAAELDPKPDPAPDAAAARARLADRDARTKVALNPLCHTILMPEATEAVDPMAGKVVLLIHGISSCPHAFVELAPRLARRGHVVFAPRMPQNGHADRSTPALGKLTAEALTEYADAAVDVACGWASELGREIVVCGISAGGTVAAWIGQNRPEVSRIVLVAPFFGLPGLGPRVNLFLTRFLLFVPNVSIWKNPWKRERYGGHAHVYKRQSTRGTAEVMRLGYAVFAQAKGVAPAVHDAALVTNAHDRAISNIIPERLVRRWARHGAEIVRHEFPTDLKLGHEVIDPADRSANTAVTYPVLEQMIEGAEDAAGVGQADAESPASQMTPA